MRSAGRETAELASRFRKLRSELRTSLNGLALNRAKFTSFSRHFTSAKVLQCIASKLQPLLHAGDTFVDFACGQNSFGALLRDPATGLPLPSRAYDILSPAETTHNFERRNWFSVDATELPPGELVIGLNPPFGHKNSEAIRFVTHAVCCQPRLLVLIMPTTNYQPPGYELVHHDDQLCRGSVFYTPGALTSNWINAKNVQPLLQIYRRREQPGAGKRVAHCKCRIDFLESLSKKRKLRDTREVRETLQSRKHQLGTSTQFPNTRLSV